MLNVILIVAGWFTGLSSKFLASRTARLLVLAGTERLDKELMIGQMQGKFQLVVIPNVGHMVHEVRGRWPVCVPRSGSGSVDIIDAGRPYADGRRTGRVLET